MANVYLLSERDLQTLGEIIGDYLLKNSQQQHTVLEKPMTRKEIGEYLGYGQTTITKLINAGILKGHRFTDDMEPKYLASEALEKLKMR